MPTYTHTAEDVINAAIQDSQVLTTNRIALLDYVNRTSLRILRESQWSFLQSGYQKFITQEGVDKYWIGSGTPPNGYSNTNLNLINAESVLPDSVYDLTFGRKLTQDAMQVRAAMPFIMRDSTIRMGPPRAYANYISDPNVVHVFPPPDNQNYYFPVPEPSLCQQVFGGVLPGRTYFIQTTLVDTQGGESIASTSFSQTIASDFLLMVSSPTAEVPSALSPSYAYWNVYISATSGGPYFKQNISPIPIGSPWIEQVTGASPTPALTTYVPIANSVGELYNITVLDSGNLQATAANVAYNTFPIYVVDPFGQVFNLTLTGAGPLQATMQPFAQISSNILLASPDGTAWKLSINSVGQLVATDEGPASGYTLDAIQPPTDPTIAPLQGYVIGFRYQQVKIPITQVTQTLQIPDAYFDVVVAGVNYYASIYMRKGDDEGFKASVWKKEFMDGLDQIRRDLRINYRNSDFIGPDAASQGDPNHSIWTWQFV